MSSFCPNHIIFQLKNFRGITCHDTQADAKFKGKLTYSLKKEIRNLVNFYVGSRKAENLHFDSILLSKQYKYLDEKIQKSYVS